MAKLFSTYGSAEDKDRISLEVRPWALAATRPGVMFYGRNGYASASGVIWADVTFAIDDVPLAYQRVLFQFTHNLDVFRGELEEVLTNGGEFKWQFGYHPELSLVVERFVPKPESFSESDEEPEQESDEESEQESDESPERASGEEPQQSSGGELENASDEELAQESGEETNQEIGETSSFNFPFVTVSTISAAEFEALTGLASGFEVDDPIVKVRLEYDFSSLVSDFVDRTGPVFKIGSALTSDVRVFLETLSEEINLVRQDVHPDPALLPPVPTFQFAKQLLARAYNNLQENPPPPSDAPRPQVDFGKTDALIARWQEMVPAQGHIVELGCGEGDDRTIGAWLRDGYRVTGIDVSGASLARARAAFPQANFLEMMPSELRAEQEFDAAYSALMFLHMDPIELRVALHRIHCALKPDAPFFVLSVVENAQVRYSPVDMYCGERVWQWYYEPEEIVRAFTEHGHFVVEGQEVVVLDGDVSEIEALTTRSLIQALESRGKRVTFAYAILARKVG